ncbi:MAG: DUF1987 domain-containing protein [Bacteroidales bacterium]|nr:DUF1987 domain-containing protein [Bacteroidales bacterium]MBO7141815.1 DUF1987 domain-containing protein [Bacteroidales bacterium]
MKPYIKTATADTPSVILDADRGIFEISQMSLPEDAVDFYAPILSWLREYAQDPNPDTVFNMKLEYFNTASSKQLIQVLLILQEMEKRSNVLVKWFYKEIDEDMLSLGEEYKQIMKVPFELIVVP